jgi:hypothetical protein
VFPCLAFNAADCLSNLQLLCQETVPLSNNGGRTVRVCSEKKVAMAVWMLANQEVYRFDILLYLIFVCF